jgi:hypothetical protein
MSLYPSEFRRTDRKETMTTVTLGLRHCKKCGQFKQQSGGQYVKGTSRHNPSRFTCKDCL